MKSKLNNSKLSKRKMIRMFTIYRLFLGLVGLLSVLGSAASEYQDELKSLEFDIEVEALKMLNTEFSPYEFAKSLNIKAPLFPPSLKPEQVTLKIEDELQRRVRKSYPTSRYEQIKEEAEKKYTMYKAGDQVTIQRHYGEQQLQVTGLLEVISKDMIKISGSTISAVDIDNDDLARLFWSEHESAIAKYVRKETHTFENAKNQFLEEERRKVTRRLWRKAGYRKSRKSGRWIPLMDAFLVKYEKNREKKLIEIRKKVRKDVYLKNKYIFDELRNGWIPEAAIIAEVEAEREKNMPFIDKMKGFFRKKTDNDSLSPSTKTPNLNKSTKPKPSIDKQVPKTEEKEEEDLWDDDLFSDDSNSDNTSKSEPEIKQNSDRKKKTVLTQEDVSDLFDENDD